MGSNGTLLDFIKKNSKNLAVPAIMLIIGLFFIIKPDGALDITVKVVGILFVIVGVLLGCSLMAAVSTVSMVLAVALVLIGIICLAASGFVASLILKVIGLCVTVNSIMSIHDAYVIKGKSSFLYTYNCCKCCCYCSRYYPCSSWYLKYHHCIQGIQRWWKIR